MVFFNRPLYLYPSPKKLSTQQLLISNQEFPFYKKLSNRKKIYFEYRVKSFLNQYKFLGKEELVVTDQMRVLIAGTYIMLTFGMRHYLVNMFNTIVLFPKAYFCNSNEAYHKGEFNPEMKAVVFSWEDFILGHQTTNDNLNLGLHEFTHVLHFHGMKSSDPSTILFYDEVNKVISFFLMKLIGIRN